MRGAERVEDEQITSFGELPRRLGIVLRLAGIEARVLEDPEAIVGEQLTQARRDRGDLEFGVRAFGTPEMRADDDFARACVEQVPQREQRGLDPRVVCNCPVLEGHVEVGSDENALARDVRLADGPRCVLHGSSFPIRSTSRQL